MTDGTGDEHVVTVVRARYFPATIRLPGEHQPRRRVYLLLTEGGQRAGLHVFTRPAEEPEVFLPVDWSATAIPTAHAARNGVPVRLADGGLAVITPGSGCRCGQMGRWAGPSWARTVQMGK